MKRATSEDQQGLLSAAATSEENETTIENDVSENEAALINSAVLDLPPEVQQHLKTLLAADEKLLFIEQPLFWPTNGPLLLITAIVVLGLSIYAIADFGGFLGSGLIVIASALALLCITVWTVYTHKQIFFALTNKHVILGRGAHEATKFKYEDMVSVTREINYLHFWRPEVAVRRKTKSPKPKVEYIDSITSLDRVEQMLRARLPRATAPIQDVAIDTNDSTKSL